MFILASQGLTTKMQLLSTPFTWVVSRRLRDGFNHWGKRPSDVNKRTTNVTYPPSIFIEKNRSKRIFITINYQHPMMFRRRDPIDKQWCLRRFLISTTWRNFPSTHFAGFFLEETLRQSDKILKKSTHSPKSRFHQIIWWGFPVKRHFVFAFFPGKISSGLYRHSKKRYRVGGGDKTRHRLWTIRLYLCRYK